MSEKSPSEYLSLTGRKRGEPQMQTRFGFRSEVNFEPFDQSVDLAEWRRAFVESMKVTYALRWGAGFGQWIAKAPDKELLTRLYGPDPADWPLYNEESMRRLGERAARAYDEARTKALLEETPRYLSGTLMPSLPGRRSAVMSPSELMLAMVRAGDTVFKEATS